MALLRLIGLQLDLEIALNDVSAKVHPCGLLAVPKEVETSDNVIEKVLPSSRQSFELYVRPQESIAEPSPNSRLC